MPLPVASTVVTMRNGSPDEPLPVTGVWPTGVQGVTLTGKPPEGIVAGPYRVPPGFAPRYRNVPHDPTSSYGEKNSYAWSATCATWQFRSGVMMTCVSGPAEVMSAAAATPANSSSWPTSSETARASRTNLWRMSPTGYGG